LGHGPSIVEKERHSLRFTRQQNVNLSETSRLWQRSDRVFFTGLEINRTSPALAVRAASMVSRIPDVDQ
jgi:hypothetical protein